MALSCPSRPRPRVSRSHSPPADSAAAAPASPAASCSFGSAASCSVCPRAACPLSPAARHASGRRLHCCSPAAAVAAASVDVVAAVGAGDRRSLARSDNCDCGLSSTAVFVYLKSVVVVAVLVPVVFVVAAVVLRY